MLLTGVRRGGQGGKYEDMNCLRELGDQLKEKLGEGIVIHPYGIDAAIEKAASIPYAKVFINIGVWRF